MSKRQQMTEEDITLKKGYRRSCRKIQRCGVSKSLRASRGKKGGDVTLKGNNQKETKGKGRGRSRPSSSRKKVGKRRK